MKIVRFVLVAALLSGCGSMAKDNVAETQIDWSKDAGGGYSFKYRNGKDITGLKAKAQIEPSTGAIIGFDVELENSNTPAAAMANAAAAQKSTAEAIGKVVELVAPIAQGAIQGGLLGGGPGAAVGAATKLLQEKANATSNQAAPAPAGSK